LETNLRPGALEVWQEVFPAEGTGFSPGKTGRTEILSPIPILFNADIFRVLQIFLLPRRRWERLGERLVASRTKNRRLHFMFPDPFIDPGLQKAELPANPGAGDLTAGHQALDLPQAKVQVFRDFFHRHYGSFHGLRPGQPRPTVLLQKVLASWIFPRISSLFQPANARHSPGDGRR